MYAKNLIEDQKDYPNINNAAMPVSYSPGESEDLSFDAICPKVLPARLSPS